MIITSHYGQHDDTCFTCKLKTLTFDRGRPKTHVKKGDPWKDNPVVERIEELKKTGAKYEAEGKKLNVALIEKKADANV